MLGTLMASQGRTLLLLTGALLMGTEAVAQQRGVEPTVKTGKLVEVARQGRVQALKFTDDAGEEQTVILNAEVQAQVEAPGDAKFLRPGVFIATLATESNGQLFANEVSVLLFGKGRAPAGRIRKAPPKPGQSQNAYQVTGTINAIGADEDYPNYQRAVLKAAGPRAPLMLEEGVKVTVKSQDFSLAGEGTPIELEGNAFPNGRFVPTKVTARLKEPLKAADIFKEEKDEAREEKGEAQEEKDEAQEKPAVDE